MPQLPVSPCEWYVLGRVHPYGWKKSRTKPKARTFIDQIENGLSVFRADVCSARQVIQHGINAAMTMASSADQDTKAKGVDQLSRFGRTVEDWVKNEWGVVKLPMSAFLERDFSYDGPEPDGHMNLFGDYALYAEDFVEIAEVLPVDECIA
jgi:hypothetical protein